MELLKAERKEGKLYPRQIRQHPYEFNLLVAVAGILARPENCFENCAACHSWAEHVQGRSSAFSYRTGLKEDNAIPYPERVYLRRVSYRKRGRDVFRRDLFLSVGKIFEIWAPSCRTDRPRD